MDSWCLCWGTSCSPWNACWIPLDWHHCTHLHLNLSLRISFSLNIFHYTSYNEHFWVIFYFYFFKDLKQGWATVFVGGPYNQIQTFKRVTLKKFFFFYVYKNSKIITMQQYVYLIYRVNFLFMFRHQIPKTVHTNIAHSLHFYRVN